MPQTLPDIVLTDEEQQALGTLARAGRGRADLARRARIVLRLAAGDSYNAIARGLGESTRTIGKWKRRFLDARVAGLEGRYRGQHADRADAAPRGPHPGVDAEGAHRWLDTLEHAETREGPEAQ